MKKLFAILVSAILLCAMIPFATVSAEGEPAIVLEPSATQVNAGDTFTVKVSLTPNPGVIAAKVALVFDKDIFEVPTQWVYDEELDEDVEEIMIKMGTGWASKYVTFGPQGTTCSVLFVNGTASKNVTRELFYTATFKVKEGVADGYYDLTVDAPAKDFVNLAGEKVAFAGDKQKITITVGNPAPAGCDHEYDDACDVDCNKCGETRETSHTPGAAADCDSAQVCTVCGAELAAALGHTWNDASCTAPKTCSVCGATEGDVLPHTPGAAADCDSAQTCTVCGEVLNPALGHTWNDASCTAPKTCSVCGATEGDVLPHSWNDASCTAPKTCSVCGATEGDVLPHTYDDEYDADCNVCGAVRDLVLPATKIIVNKANAVSEDKNGLAFKFDAYVNISYDENTFVGDYTTAKVTIDGVEYKLVDMGAILNNKGLANQELGNVDDTYVLKVKAEKVFEDAAGNTSFAIRVLKLDDDAKKGTIITARSYLTYADADGNEFTVYGDDWATSYNAEAN